MAQVASPSNLNPTLEYDFTKDIRFRIRAEFRTSSVQPSGCTARNAAAFGTFGTSIGKLDRLESVSRVFLHCDLR